jgi:methylase of polypeptide subunit release factors
VLLLLQVHCGCFFEGHQGLHGPIDWLVANPPYLPAPDNDIFMVP